ncbi:MAG: CAT RNA binding domain-containing protein, partial [Eisenbergiella sp.]
MKIQKVINNNVISALDENGQEIVAMGRGIGFQKKAGEEMPESAVEKVFRLESPDLLERFKQVLANMPLECIQISDRIISYAKERLSMRLN